MKNYLIKRSLLLVLAILPLLFISCGQDDVIIEPDPEEEEEPIPSDSPNILLIIADDMGLDATNGYLEGAQKPTTPHLDSLMNNGVKFTNVWVNPTCSPTRSSIITGKYGHSTNVLGAGDILSSEHQLLQSYINESTDDTYATAVVGKWHLAGSNSNFNPETLGIDYYAGMISGTANSYYSWNFTEDGTTTTETQYISEKFTDLGINWVQQQEQPWFLWLAYTAPHSPFHLPPSSMHSQGNLPDDEASINSNTLPYYFAAIEAMDYQLGRLMDEMSQAQKENTYVIFLGDNGTPAKVSQAPYGRGKAKGSIYQGGIHVPMFITGPGVVMGEQDALINGTDLFATIATLAGSSTETINDSRSFEPLLMGSSMDQRTYAYSEMIDDNEEVHWCIRTAEYKLIEYANGTQEFYDLANDPYETNDLLLGSLSNSETSAKNALAAEAAQIRQ